MATLLSHHYDEPTDELAVFKAMWEKGRQEKIRKEGFSLLDMKSYLDGRGYYSDGFRVAASRLEEIGVAGIVLLDKLASPHFVVVIGERDGELLLSDPARGIWNLAVEDFDALWNGVFFVVRQEAGVARLNFNDAAAWKRARGDERSRSL